MLELQQRPDFSKPENFEKAINLLKICDEIDKMGSLSIHSSVLTAYLGNQARPIGAYLRFGLKRIKNYVAGKYSYSYEVNKQFVDALRQHLESLVEKPKCAKASKKTVKEVKEVKAKEFKIEPRSAGKFVKNRYYTWYTRLPAEKRKALFISQYGKFFDYDISVARPSILLSIYDRTIDDNFKNVKNILDIPTWRNLVLDKMHWRQTIMDDCGISYKNVKLIQQSIANGGFASLSPKNPIRQLIGTDRTQRLLAHELYLGLIKDFKRVRQVIFPLAKAREARKLLSNLYVSNENAIMELIEKELNKQKIPAWFVHDGFFTYEDIEPSTLEEVIRNNIGFNIRIEKNY